MTENTQSPPADQFYQVPIILFIAPGFLILVALLFSGGDTHFRTDMLAMGVMYLPIIVPMLWHRYANIPVRFELATTYGILGITSATVFSLYYPGGLASDLSIPAMAAGVSDWWDFLGSLFWHSPAVYVSMLAVGLFLLGIATQTRQKLAALVLLVVPHLIVAWGSVIVWTEVFGFLFIILFTGITFGAPLYVWSKWISSNDTADSTSLTT